MQASLCRRRLATSRDDEGAAISSESDTSSAHREDGRDYPADVHLARVDGREFIIVGTAHISQESADLVREVIERERPDCVCIELDAQRYAALSQKARWEALDLKQVIRDKQLAALLANLVLASYQKKLGGALGVLPGTELLEAAKAADALGIPISLCDRDVRVTLRRAWASMSFFKKIQLLSTLAVSLFESPEIGEEELRKLRERDVLSELMRELGEAMPTLKRTLIDERDTFLTQKMKRGPRREDRRRGGSGPRRRHLPGPARAPRRRPRGDQCRCRRCRRSGSGSAGGSPR